MKPAEITAGKITNSMPSDGWFARVMPRAAAEEILNGTGKLALDKEAWITAAEDLEGINTIEGAAKRLTLIDETGALKLHNDVVLEFRLKDLNGFQTPYNRTNPGFINGGRTGGGAREWIIPSDKEITDIIIKNLILERMRNLKCECDSEGVLKGNEAALFRRKYLEVIKFDGYKWRGLYRCKECGVLWEETYKEDGRTETPTLQKVDEEYARKNCGPIEGL